MNGYWTGVCVCRGHSKSELSYHTRYDSRLDDRRREDTQSAKTTSCFSSNKLLEANSPHTYTKHADNARSGTNVGGCVIKCSKKSENEKAPR
jgi:hypothetical protein